MSAFDELVGLFLTEDMREFKGASELDDSLIKSIRKEYFRKTFVLPVICIFISLAIVTLWLFDVIQPQLLAGIVSEDIFSIALMLLVAFSGLAASVSTVRCIFSLIIVSKIKKLRIHLVVFLISCHLKKQRYQQKLLLNCLHFLV